MRAGHETSAGPASGVVSAREGWAKCPVTGKPVAPDSPTFPFFDEKARLVDLSRWFRGEYTVSREIVEDDLGDPDLGPMR